MIVDCFTFFNELDVLELRLSLFGDIVDRFVLCEAPFTFRGDPKPLFYAQNKARFARWNDRIVHLVYDVPPDANPWKNEWGQRAYLTTGLRDLEPDALVLIGDVDEMPLPGYLAHWPEPGRVLAHRHALAVGYVNRIVTERWIGTKAIRYGDLGDRTLEDIRSLPLGTFDVADSGWHFSALGGPSVMAAKIRAYSHVEADIPYFTDERRLTVQFESETNAEWVPLDDAFPATLREPRWSTFVWRAPAYTREEAAHLIHAHGSFASVPADAPALAALVRTAQPLWQRAGAERYGEAFAGAHGDVPSLLAALPRGAWAVVGEFGDWSPAELRALADAGVHAVAYATNARSFAVLSTVIEGAPFPAGRARGIAELEAAAGAAGYRVESRDDVMGSVFAPSVWDEPEPFDVGAGPFRFGGTTRSAMHHFSAVGYVFKLRSARA